MTANSPVVVRTDGGDEYRCGLCQSAHPTRGEALQCCSERFDDDPIPDGGVPEADTRPTDRRGGEKLPPTRVECPFCGREGVTEREVNRCACGRWFEVVAEVRADGGQPVEDGEQSADDAGETVSVAFTDERDVCPECGLVPSGIRTEGPDTHVLEPCGHAATIAVRRAVLERTLPDGGGDLAARLVEYLEYLYLEADQGTLRWPEQDRKALAADLQRFREAWGIEPQTPHPAVHFDDGASGGEQS